MVGLREQHGSWGETARANMHLDNKSNVLQAQALLGKLKPARVRPMVALGEKKGEGGSSLVFIKTPHPPISWAFGDGGSSAWPMTRRLRAEIGGARLAAAGRVAGHCPLCTWWPFPSVFFLLDLFYSFQ